MNFPRKRLILTTLAIAFYGVGIGVSMSVFNNFLNDVYHLGADARGWLELPRETPGFLTAAAAGLLFFLTDIRMAVVAVALAAAGNFLMAAAGPSFGLMIFFMMVGSMGDHLYFALKSALTLSCCSEHNRGRILGVTGSFEVLGIVIGGVVARWMSGWGASYLAMFSVLAVSNLLASATLAALPPDAHAAANRPKIVLRRRYNLYYVLEFLFGARKQIFLTFGPWVLIQIFGCGVKTFALLTIAGHLIAFVIRPLAGWAVDRYGERIVLIVDGFILIWICLGYAFANDLPWAEWRFPTAVVCFLLDEILFFISIARTTYIAKIVKERSELSACLTAGVSINHIASMTVPLFAGALWTAAGHEMLFVGAAGVAVSIIAASMRVPRKGEL
jgi:MFS family permease